MTGNDYFKWFGGCQQALSGQIGFLQAAPLNWSMQRCCSETWNRAMHRKRICFQRAELPGHGSIGKDRLAPGLSGHPGRPPGGGCRAASIADIIGMLALFFLILVMPSCALCQQKADFVLVVKSESALYLQKDGKTIKKFPVVFGAHPMGHKQKSEHPKGVIFLITRRRTAHSTRRSTSQGMDEIWQAVDAGTPIEIKP
ncbi:MAG: hypothetical protein P8X55_07100 [Desulfosarcinaceae bacterium]